MYGSERLKEQMAIAYKMRPKGARLIIPRPEGVENWEITPEMILEAGHKGGCILVDCEGVWTCP